MKTFTKAIQFVQDHQNHAYYRLRGEKDSSSDAAHAVTDDGHVSAIFIEPRRRNEGDWTSEDESRMVEAIRAEVVQWDTDSWHWLQFDPGRDQCEEIRNDKSARFTANDLVHKTPVPAWADGAAAFEGTSGREGNDDRYDLYRNGQCVGCMYDEGDGYEFAEGVRTTELADAN